MDDDGSSEPPIPAFPSTSAAAYTVAASSSQQASLRVAPNPAASPAMINRRPYVRQFHAGYTGPLEVCIRSANNMRLANIPIQSALNSRFSSIASIKPDRSKISVIFGTREEANSLLRQSLEQDVVVFIPENRRVDVHGAVRADDIDDDLGVLIEEGRGIFGADGLPPCRVLYAERIFSAPSGNNSHRTATNTVKITFEGTILPKYIGIGNLRVPVRLFWSAPRFCSKCQTHRHTDKVCRRPPKCARCHEAHLTADCSNKAVNKLLCPFCAMEHDDFRHLCAYFQQVKIDYKAKQIEANKLRYQQAVSSLRAQNVTNKRPRQQAPAATDANFPPLRNSFASLAAVQLDDNAHDAVVDGAIDTHDNVPNRHVFPPPPKNPYASKPRGRTLNKRYRDGSSVSRRSAREQPSRQQPAAAHLAPNVPIQRQPEPQHQPRRMASVVRSPAAQGVQPVMQTGALRLILLTFARQLGVPNEKMAMLEAALDPILAALLPNADAIVAAVTSHLQKNVS